MISIIIPAFNREAFLNKAIESVLQQSFQDFELIVVDDGSRDNTYGVVSRFSDRIKYVKQENKGPGCARNRGIKESTRDFIAFLDSDDWWDKEKLALQIRYMQENPAYLISHTDEVWYKNGAILNQKKKHKKFHGYIFGKCLSLCCVSMSTVMLRRELFNRVGFFDESMLCCEDYDFWLRAGIKHEFLFLDKPLTLKDGGRGDQLSFIYRIGIDKFRISSILKVINSGVLDDEQFEFASRELRKKCTIYGNGCIKHKRQKEGEYYLELCNRI